MRLYVVSLVRFVLARLCYVVALLACSIKEEGSYKNFQKIIVLEANDCTFDFFYHGLYSAWGGGCMHGE